MPSNLPDPSNIPDMSLGERSDPPPAPVQPIPPSENPPSANNAVTPRPLPAPKELAVPADWQEGDRVLAPWEPTFLYAGTIKRFKIDEARGDQAMIEFDDGDDGWVFLYSLCPLHVAKGQRVLSRRKMGPLFEPAEILEVRGEEVCVGFDERGFEWTTVAALRIPCVMNGPGAVGTKFNANRPPPMVQQSGGGIPSWAIWVGIAVLSAIVRFGCRAMDHH